MRFVDEAIIEVAAGDGGRGCVSFLHLPFKPKAGPDGGDGGRGGDVKVRATNRVTTLADHSYLRHFRAGRGGHGQGSSRTGRGGTDKMIEVPVGTLVKDLETDELLADLTKDGQEVIVARGGQGGRGNQFFTTSTNRAPRYAQPGCPGEQKTLKLELKLLADVGLVGLPNAGKSSLIRAVSRARPKVGDYPFTTLTPHLGVAQAEKGLPFTVADIPGLVEGSHKGAGLGLRFLKHVERTRLFVYVIDLGAEDPAGDLATVQAEIAAYDPKMAQRAGLVVANKIDLVPDRRKLTGLQRQLKKQDLTVLGLSALTGQGIKDFIETVSQLLEEHNRETDVEQG